MAEKDQNKLKALEAAIAHIEKEYGKGKKWNLTLILSDNNGKCMAKNTYQDICTLLSRVDGHPDRMSHEFGMRLYWA